MWSLVRTKKTYMSISYLSPISIARIISDFSTAAARRLKPSRATAVWHGKPCRATRK